MQVQAFMPLLEKYEDYDTSPANEPIERIEARLGQLFSDYYIITSCDTPVGGIRIVKREGQVYRVSPIFIVPAYQGQGIAQQAFALVEDRYPDAVRWELDTIMQEEGNCRLYEKLGYRRTGQTKAINDRMTLVVYAKIMNAAQE